MDILSNKKYRTLSPEQLWSELSIDYCYYLATGGGITFGGGESLLHSKAIRKFIDIIPEGVAINLETSLNVPLGERMFLDIIEKVLDTGGQLIIDTKALDSDMYSQYTMQDNTKVQSNLRLLVDNGYQEKCIIRVPIIPEYKSKEVAKSEEIYYRKMGFTNIDVFDYVIRDYMTKEQE